MQCNAHFICEFHQMIFENTVKNFNPEFSSKPGIQITGIGIPTIDIFCPFTRWDVLYVTFKVCNLCTVHTSTPNANIVHEKYFEIGQLSAYFLFYRDLLNVSEYTVLLH